MQKELEILGEKKWTGRVTSDTAYYRRADYGVVPNTMRLIKSKYNLYIEWIVGDEKDPIDGAEIGITTVGKSVTDYDGVFELPKEAIELLNEYGLDTKEVESDYLDKK